MGKDTVKTNSIRASLEETQDQALMAEASQLLRDAGSTDPEVASEAQHEIALQAAEVLREGVLDGDVVTPIYLKEPFDNDFMRLELDLLSPGTEKEHVAYVMPDHGKVPHRQVESDYIMLNTYQITSSIDCTRNYFRNTRFDVLRRMLEVLEAGFVKKKNDDGWQTLLAAANGRGIQVFDGGSTTGVFTPQLVNLMKTVMRRNGGGNSTSLNRRKLTDIYLSPEASADMATWQLNLIPDALRENIFRSESGSINGLFGVNFTELDELGVSQEYQLYFTAASPNGLGATLANSGVELVVGLDLTAKDKSFLMPTTEALSVFEDNMLHRSGRVGFYGFETMGFAVLDIRYILPGAF